MTDEQKVFKVAMLLAPPPEEGVHDIDVLSERWIFSRIAGWKFIRPREACNGDFNAEWGMYPNLP